MNNSKLKERLIGSLGCVIIFMLCTGVAMGQGLPPLTYEHNHEKQSEADSLEEILSGFTDDYVDLLSDLEEMMAEFETLFEDYGRISLKETEKSLYKLQQLLYNEYSEKARQEMMVQLEVTLKSLKTVEVERDEVDRKSVSKYLRRLRAMEDDLEDIEQQLEEEFEELDALELIDSERLSRAINRALKEYYKGYSDGFGGVIVSVPEVPRVGRGVRLPKPLRAPRPTRSGVATYFDHGEYDNFLTRSALVEVDDGEVVIALENALGGVTVTTWNRNEIKAELTIGYSEYSKKSKSKAEEIELLVNNHNGRMVIIKVNYPGTGDNILNIVSSQLDVTLPRANQLKVDNSFGPVSISDLDNKIIVNSAFARVEIDNIDGDLMLNNANGTVYLEKINGHVTVNNSFGAIEVLNITGGLRLTNSYAPITTRKTIGQLDIKSSGSVSVRKHKGGADIHSSNGEMEIYAIRGNLVAVNSFGDMRVEGVIGNAELENSNARLEVYKVDGYLKASNRFADIHAEAITEQTWVECSNGEVTIENVGGDVVVSNRFGEVNISSADGSVRVSNSGSPITISDVTGDVEVVNQHAPVFLEQIGGNVDIENQNASIDLIEISGVSVISTTYGLISCERLGGSFSIGNDNGSVELIDIIGIYDDCRITTTSGDITVTLPRNGKFNLKVHTSWGSIDSDFPMKINSQGSATWGEYISGQSLPTIILSGKNTSIVVLME